MTRLEVAFYAPLKAPDHPTPSGDRTMARALVAAIEAGGHAATLVSRLRAYTAAPDPEGFAARRAAARAEVERVARSWSRPDAGPPDLWFTYHPYYKAPDLIGPALAARFGLPYVTAEASLSGKRATGPWAEGHAATEVAVRAAALNVCFTARDREGLAVALADGARILCVPPFIASRGGVSAPRGPKPRVELATVAMMRPGDKARSYACLARALAALPPDPDWHLTIVGDGPARDATRAAFARVPAGRMTWLGERTEPEVRDVLAGADLYVWPGFGEAYGLAYLEAAAAGLPSVAMACGGVASVVLDGRTGLLAPEGDEAAFGEALRRVMTDTPLRRELGTRALSLAREERTVARAGALLARAFEDLRQGVARVDA